jgi:hypothetical protein
VAKSKSEIVYGQKPKKDPGERPMKWAPVIQEVIDNCPPDQDARVAVRKSSSAASGIAQTIRKTAEKMKVDIQVSTRKDPDDGTVGVWLTPNRDGQKPKKAAKKSTTKKAAAKSSTKATTQKSTGGSRRRRTVKSKS